MIAPQSSQSLCDLALFLYVISVLGGALDEEIKNENDGKSCPDNRSMKEN